MSNCSRATAACSRAAGRWPASIACARARQPSSVRPRPTRSRWSARGERRELRGGEGQTWLHLTADCRVALQCQRCLQPVGCELAVQRAFLFVAGEDAAAQLDADSEDDVLALTRALDLRELIEDELLLALPLVPRHEVCPAPLPFIADEEPARAENPFAGAGRR